VNRRRGKMEEEEEEEAEGEGRLLYLELGGGWEKWGWIGLGGRSRQQFKG
jgi:hypothetical protein